MNMRVEDNNINDLYNKYIDYHFVKLRITSQLLFTLVVIKLRDYPEWETTI